MIILQTKKCLIIFLDLQRNVLIGNQKKDPILKDLWNYFKIWFHWTQNWLKVTLQMLKSAIMPQIYFCAFSVIKVSFPMISFILSTAIRSSVDGTHIVELLEEVIKTHITKEDVCKNASGAFSMLFHETSMKFDPNQFHPFHSNLFFCSWPSHCWVAWGSD